MNGGRDRPPLSARDVDVRVGGGLLLLDSVSLDLHAGELLAVVGPNGAGKSTLLAVLAGDRRADAGQVLVHGRPVHRYRPAQLARIRAVLPQRPTLAFPFTAAEVVRMGRAAHRRRGAGDDDRVVAACLAATDTAHLAERPYPQLSGGEQARVSFARVLAQQAPVLLLDEPTASLDLGHQEHVMGLARRRAHEAGDAVLAVVHDLTLAAAYADRVAVLCAGRLVTCGPPGQVFTAALLSDVYGHPVEVFAHPGQAGPLILPVRAPAPP